MPVFSYNSSIQNAIIVFGHIFEDYRVVRYQADGVNKKQQIIVPIFYAPQDKTLMQIRDKSNLEKSTMSKLPRMSYEVVGLDLATEVSKNYSAALCAPISGDNDKNRVTSSPTPYRLSFALKIYADNYEDIIQLVEQILPNYNPSYTIDLKLISNANFSNVLKSDFTLNLDSINISRDNYESLENQTLFIGELNFNVIVNLFGGFTDSKVIKQVEINYLLGDEKSNPDDPYATERTRVDPINAGPNDNYTIIKTYVEE